MITALLHQPVRKLRFAWSFLRRRLVHVNLQILYTCNYRCRICDFWKPEYRDQPRLSAADASLIAAQLNRLGPQIVSIGGGEPMLHPELIAIVRTLARYHFPVMITNGSQVTPANARALWAAGLVEISVSVDYATPAAHDAQRGARGAYPRALEALAILHAQRTHPAQRVHMISVVLDDNLPDLEPLIRQCEQLGITHLVTLYSHSRGGKPTRSGDVDVSRHLLALKRRHRHFVALRSYLARSSEAIREHGIGPCRAGQHLCNIDSAGNVTFCIDRLAEPVGNLLRDDVVELAARLRCRSRDNPCRDCWTSCRGSIESLMYGRHRWAALWDYHQMTRPVALGGRF